jgi:hypothetical protein
MTTLTPDQLIDATAKLVFVKVLHQQVAERIVKQREMLDAGESDKFRVYVIVTEAMQAIEQEHVDELAELLGVENDAENKLATVPR